MMDFEVEAKRIEVTIEEDEYDKRYCSFRNSRILYNKDNLTSVNE